MIHAEAVMGKTIAVKVWKTKWVFDCIKAVFMLVVWMRCHKRETKKYL